MSSTEASDPIPSRSGRKSQRSRACDMCRRRKVRCDGSVAEDRVCTNCVAFKFKCTYVQSAPQRVLDTRYIACLEEQLTEMRSLLAQYRQLYPNGEPSPLVSPSIFSTIPAEASPASPLERPDISDAIDISMPMSTAPIAKPVFSLSTIPTPTLADEEPDFDPSDDEVSTSKAMMTPFARSPLFPGNNSFQGKSSSMMMVSAALHSKREYIKGRAKKPKKMFRIPRDDEMDIRDSAGPKKRKEKEEDDVQVKNAPWCPATRADAWSDYPWILRTINRPQTQLEFPPPDLLEQLLSIYFSDLNSFIPLLHRPTFMKSVQDGLHKSDEGFGIVLLLVCALAAKRCNDPRVLLEEEIRKNNCIQHGNVEGVGENHKTYHSAGWFWFEQVRMSRFGISFQPTTLYQMQAAYLIASYTWETSMAWHGAGYGIRVAQMMGAHRKKSYSTEPTVEGELRKRAFWALILHDRSHSSIFGRACSIQDEDFDLDLPIVCDDEYWEQSDPGQDFQQPEGKPSKVAYFNCMLRLSQIHAYTLRTIYSINKSKALLGLVGHDWQRRIVSQIDSALNRWLDSVPLHLQWDSQVKSDLFYNQSANLHAAYYTLRIIVHRPFIRSPHNPSISSSPSLLVCTDAARSCINLLHEQFTRTGHVHDQYALFTSAIAILLNIWAGRKSMTPLETEVEMQRVHKVMDIVQTLEPWGHGSAKIWDTLSNLIKMGERPTHTLEESGPISKRARNEQIPSSDFQNAPLAERELTGSYEYQEQSRLQESHVRTETSGRTGGNGSAISAGSDLRPVIDYSSTAMAPSFMAAPAHEQSQYDSTHAPIDPVIQALLSMLSPAQYQQPQSSPAMGEMSPSSHGVQGGTAWNHDILAAEMNSGIPRTMGAASDLHSPQTTVPGGIPEWDPSSTWTSAPSGFGWEDWGAYLTNFREDNGQPSDNRSGNAEYPH